MTDKEKLIKIKSLADKMSDTAFNITTDASLLKKAIDEYHQFIINEYHKEEQIIKELQEKPVSNNYSVVLLPCIYNRTLEERVKYCKYCSAACEGRVKEPVSEELEEASEQLAENARKRKAETASPFFSQTDYRQGVMDGAKWQKQQMMSKAVDAHVNYAWSGLSFSGFNWSKTGLDIGDRCKLIIIKED